mmetsp:Transcript_4768/g.10348  ORF Transcript_4768/g.10348 Transcript_4768/m.10348 type:complete len:579 (+) Transcript_4768:361-2097(+)
MARRQKFKKIIKTLACLLPWAWCLSFRNKITNSLEKNVSLIPQLEVAVMIEDEGKLCFGYNCAWFTAVAVLSLCANTSVLIISHCPTGAPSVFADMPGVSFICHRGLLSENALTALLAHARSEYIFIAQPGDLPVVPNMKAHIAQIKRGLRHQLASRGGTYMENILEMRAIARRESTHAFTYWVGANVNACDSAWMTLPSDPCHWQLSDFVAFLQFLRAAAVNNVISESIPISYLDAISDVLTCQTNDFPTSSEKVIGMFCEVLRDFSVVPRHTQQAAQIWRAYNCEKYTSSKKDVCFVVPFLPSEASDVTLSDLLRDLSLVDVRTEVILVQDCTSHRSGTAFTANNSGVLQVLSPLISAGGARNFGTNFCVADYIMYIDDDDRIDSQCLTDSIRKAISEYTEIMFLPYQIAYKEMTELVVMGMWPQDRNILQQKIPDAVKFLYTTAYPWTKLTKRSVIQNTGGPFTHTRVHNDIYFHWRIHREANKFTFATCSVVTHIKYDTTTSISSLRGENRFDALIAFQLMMDEFCSVNTSDMSCSKLKRTIKSVGEWNMKKMSNFHRHSFQQGIDDLLQVQSM